MKIRIIGACGSGKTYLSQKLSKLTDIPYYETDNIIWNRVKNEKYSLDVRNKRLREILKQDKWIIEGAQYKWSVESFEEADLIIVLKTFSLVRDYRVIKRYFKMKLRISEYNYVQSLQEMIDTLNQNKLFDRKSYEEILEITRVYEDKRVILKSNRLTKRQADKLTHFT